MPVYLIGGSPKPFFSVLVVLLAVLDLLTLLLELAEFRVELIALIDQLTHLGQQHNIGQV